MNTAMGTIVNQTIYMQTEDSEIPEEILGQIVELEQELLSWRLDTSELYQINESGKTEEGIPLSEELEGILEECLKVSNASEGAFDITLGDVVQLWDIDRWAGETDTSGYRPPDEKEVQEKLAATGYESLQLENGSLFFAKEVRLDLGAVGKGIALDYIREYLRQQEHVTGAVISVGGSILTYGSKPDSTSWKVGVVNPHDNATNIGYLSLSGEWCVSTSGNYERFVEIDGTRYHHIIDPDTGYPADSGVSSVTILTKDGLLSDALSTACFILGWEKGSVLVEAFSAEALFVDMEGNISMTEGMQQYFKLSDR